MWQQVEWTGGGTDFGGGDPQVACRRCQATMTKKQLNGPDIGAGFEQVDGEGMSKAVRRDRFGEARSLMCLHAGVFDGVSADRVTRLVPREQPVFRAGGLPVVAQNLQQPGGQHDVGVLLTFALFDTNDHPLAIDGWSLEPNGFRDTYTGGVTGGQNHAMIKLVYTGEEMQHLLGAEDEGQLLRLLW